MNAGNDPSSQESIRLESRSETFSSRSIESRFFSCVRVCVFVCICVCVRVYVCVCVHVSV